MQVLGGWGGGRCSVWGRVSGLLKIERAHARSVGNENEEKEA